MKVLLASTITPFTEGGATIIVDWLALTLEEYGHQVEVLNFPFSFQYHEMLDQILGLRLLDIADRCDRLIAIRTPSYMLKHPRKVLWFIHHHRSAYDLWLSKYQNLPKTPEGLRYRDAIVASDNVAFGEAARIFSNSKVVAERLKKYNNVDAEVLYPPLYKPERYHNAGYGDYILYLSRMTHHKRQWLAIEGLRHARTPVKLLIVGKPDHDAAPYVEQLRASVRKYGLESRVSFVSKWVSEQEKIHMFAECLAAMYMPLDEDSYGYPSLEAHHASKAMITTTDSGGTLELVNDGENGLVTSPDPEAIGAAMDRLYQDRQLTKRLGQAGPARIERLGITWRKVVEKLLS